MATMERTMSLSQDLSTEDGTLAPSCVTTDAYNRCSVFGAALVSTEIYDSEICLHGPQGCMQTVREAYALQNREYDYCQTAMSQKSVIFGGTQVLISALLETMDPYDRAGPKILVSTCAPEIIGDDVEDVISRINPRLPVGGVSGGFRGNHYWGINETLLQLVKKFVDPYPFPEPGLVNLVGNLGGARQWRADVGEMIRLLSALGLTVNRLGCNNVLDDLRKVSRAEATLLMTPEIGEPTANYLHRIFDIPILISPLGLPLGLRGTEVWLQTVAEKLNVDAERLNSLLGREEEEVRIKLKVGLNNMVFIEKTTLLKHLPVAVVAEGVVALSWARFLAEELEMNPCVVALRTQLPKHDFHPDLLAWLESSNGHKVLIEPSVETVRQILAKTRPHLVLGSSLEAEMVRELDLPAFLHIAHPNTQYVDIIEHPYLGYKGLLQACQHIFDRI